MSLAQSLDQSLNIGEEIRFKQKYKRLMIKLSKQLHFSYSEIEHLSIIYYKLQKLGDGKSVPLRRGQVKDVMHNGLDLTDDRFTPYILSYFNKNLTPYIPLQNWLRMMSIYLRGTLEEHINYCYTVYKSMSISDKLLRNHMLTLLKYSLIKDNNENDEEAVKDMVDMIIKKMDYDRDGKISFDDYRQCVLESPYFLQTFGTIIPSRLALYAFKTTFTQPIKK